MKKIFVLFFLLTLLDQTYAQELKKFRVGVGIGNVRRNAEDPKDRLLVYLEPAYRLTDAIQVGLRLEQAMMSKSLASPAGNTMLFNASTISSFSFNGQYYFGHRALRPSAGLGLGFYALKGMEASITNANAPFTEMSIDKVKLGLYPRVGFDVGHFNLSLDYNLIPTVKIAEAKARNSYLSLRMGVFFGGGKRAPQQ